MTADMKGTEILGYCLVGLIGEGGMDNVWWAKYLISEKSWVIKILDPLLARNETLIKYRTNERKAHCHCG